MKRIPRLCGAGLLLLLAVEVPALAQIRLPGGPRGVGLPPPIPGGGRQRRTKPDQTPEQPLANFSGAVRSMDAKTLRLEGPEERPLQFDCSKKTRYYDGSKKIKASVIKPGNRVSVEARRAPDGRLEAVNVRLEHEGTSS